jgi:hypothetical protein
MIATGTLFSTSSGEQGIAPVLWTGRHDESRELGKASGIITI